ncbi:MAG TPA: GAP family protein [Gaiellaceae bacterium]|nr:GAP family protein [Gaiellaceae bacterium]
MWGIVIGLGVAMALQPLPVLAVVLLLSAESGLSKARAFLFGELLVVFVIAAATVAVHSGTSRESASRPASWVTLAAGLALLAAGAIWTRRLRRGVEPPQPSWMARLDRMEPWPAFLLGTFIPTYAIAVAAGAHIVGVHPGKAEAIAAVVVFVFIGTSTVYTPVLLAQFVPERSGPMRARLRAWLERRWASVGCALLLLVGAALLAKGLVALA